MLFDNKLSEHADLLCSGRTTVGGGQSTIGDFDGNSATLEIAVATGKSLTIFNNKGAKVAGYTTQDCSSLSTGITSFDFNGDGKPEIIYADEQYVRIFEMDGSNNLKVIWSEINPSGTLREYPVVADVDGDGYSELVVVANNMWVDVNSVYQTPEQRDLARPVTGLRVFGPQSVRAWMPTRAVWNQHAYMASNVTDDLKATASTLVNGAYPTFFKRNVQKGLFQQTCEVKK
ncbi:FG-GAP repeat protein [compost metagenome]